jgi:hypothetical protein
MKPQRAYSARPVQLAASGLQRGDATPPGSPAIDAIAEADCVDLAGNPVAEDQRGVDRPQGAGCDIGAFEWSGEDEE